jgi:ADP-heptose:LPS heptosyltransferase
MNDKICLVRKGHMGDVILTEPIAASLTAVGFTVALCTEYLNVGHLLENYAAVHPYTDFLDDKLGSYDKVHELRYELHPYSHYLDAYADDVGINLKRRVPHFRVNFTPLIPGRYGIIAPHTSNWMQHMRTWPIERYMEIAQLLPKRCGFSWRLLQPSDTFDEMMSLVANAAFFIGNDSGPAVIAQSFSVPSLVLFGATKSEQVLFGTNAHGITFPIGCNGCRHITRHTDIGCTVPLCIDGISVETVLSEVDGLLDGCGLRASREGWSQYGN